MDFRLNITNPRNSRTNTFQTFWSKRLFGDLVLADISLLAPGIMAFKLLSTFLCARCAHSGCPRQLSRWFDCLQDPLHQAPMHRSIDDSHADRKTDPPDFEKSTFQRPKSFHKIAPNAEKHCPSRVARRPQRATGVEQIVPGGPDVGRRSDGGHKSAIWELQGG